MWKLVIALLILRDLNRQAPAARSSSTAQDVFASELASSNLSPIGRNSRGDVVYAPDQRGGDVVSDRIHKIASIGPTTQQQQQSLLSSLEGGDFNLSASGGNIYDIGFADESSLEGTRGGAHEGFV